MAQEIKDLIEKIQQEGIQAAQNQARRIEEEARQKADALLEKVNLEAAKIIAEAKDKNVKAEESTKALLKQAGRDLLLSLRKEINAMLEKIIVTHVRDALRPEEMAKIIGGLIKDYHTEEKEGITVFLKKEDAQNLEKLFLSELKEKIKHGIALKPSEDIAGGFIISYDAGKSQYDFTDKAIAGYIGSYLKPKLAEILK